VLRDGRVARVRARVIDPDGQPAADRLGGARARGRAPRCCAPGVHARLQPLGCPRRALGAAAAGGEPGDARRRARPVRDADLALRLHAVRERPRQHRVCEEDDAGALAGGGSTGRAVDRPVRPPRRRLPDGRLARRLGGRRRPPGVGGAEPVRLRRQRHADPGIREPGADDHGARLASGAAPGREAAGRLEGAGGSGALMQPGFPLWLVVTHFLNILFLTLLARSGLEILSAFPKLYLSDHCPPGRELVRFTRRTFRPESPPTWTSLDEEESWSPVIALPGRKNLGLARHWHFMTIQFWILTGLVYVALLFVDAQWRRLVPTSWSIFPNAVHAIGSYLHGDLAPPQHGLPYNGAQQLAYFGVVFVLAPLQILTGLTMSPSIVGRFPWYPRLFGGRQAARTLHFAILCAFAGFVVVHTAMVVIHGIPHEWTAIALGSYERSHTLALAVGTAGGRSVCSVTSSTRSSACSRAPSPRASGSTTGTSRPSTASTAARRPAPAIASSPARASGATAWRSPGSSSNRSGSRSRSCAPSAGRGR